MAENAPQSTEQSGFVDLSANNEEVARKLAAQTLDTLPNVDTSSGDALDALLKEKQKPAPEADEAEKKAAEEKAAAEVAANDPEKKAEADAAAKAAAEKTEADKKRADEFFKDSPSLPPGASPKSSEAFATIKVRAAQEISARDSQIEELKKKASELEEALKKPVPDEVEKELKDLREWRAKLDVEIDPKFKEYEKSISGSREFIYSLLKKSPRIGEDVIDRIKKIGGPDMVQLDKIFETVADPTVQRLIEAKIADIEQAKFNKEQAQLAAKNNVTEYLSARQKEIEESATQHNTQTQTVLNTILPQLDYLKEKPVPATADEPTRRALEAHNKFAKELGGNIQVALQDDSPDMRAVMIVGMAQLLHLKPQFAAATARVAELEKQLKEATEKIDKFKGASVSRLRESAVPPGGKLPENKDALDLNTRPGDALDALARKITEERQRAGK